MLTNQLADSGSPTRRKSRPFTAEGRKKARDYEFERIQRRMRKDKSLDSLSLYQRGTLAQLRLIGQDLYLDIKRRGVILSDGSVNPAVEAHRKNVHEQLYSLSVYADTNRAHASAPVDLVAVMAGRSAEAVEPVEVEPPAESVNEKSSDENQSDP